MLHDPWQWVFASVVFTQFLKLGLYGVAHRQWNLRALVMTNGLPSSYATGFACLCTVVARREGLDSALFFLSFGFAGIVLHDLVRVQGSVDAGQRRTADLASVVGSGQAGWLDQLAPLLSDRHHRPLHVALGLILGTLFGWLGRLGT